MSFKSESFFKLFMCSCVTCAVEFGSHIYFIVGLEWRPWPLAHLSHRHGMVVVVLIVIITNTISISITNSSANST